MSTSRFKHLGQTRSHRGLALVFVLVMMAIATAIALIAARITLLSDRGARNDRERQVALQSAELALQDARDDIMSPAKARGCQFGLPIMAPVAGCQADSAARGLCGPNEALGNKPLYKDINWEDTSDSTRAYVNYGEFTGRLNTLQVGTFGAPAKAPKYIVVDETNTLNFFVQYPDGTPLKVARPSQSVRGNSAMANLAAFRVFALGYGTSPDIQVMLEAVILKPANSSQCS
jgi:type IV pilus assembly protein PilX